MKNKIELVMDMKLKSDTFILLKEIKIKEDKVINKIEFCLRV